MAYTPRTSGPDSSNRYYFADNPFYRAGFGMPNCTCYAFGRFWEVLGSYPNLSTGNAQDFYGHSDEYKRGQDPKLGAILCLSGGSYSGCGHVAVVEQIVSSTHIVTSNSGWQSDYFWMQDIYKNGSSWAYGSYGFQGFIYNPKVSDGPSADAYIQEALKHEGEDGTWTYSVSGLSKGSPWCAAFVVAVAKKTGAADKVIPSGIFVIGTLVNTAIDRGMGVWVDGPLNGKSPVPQKGDLMLTSSSGNRNRSNASHIEIVVDASSSMIKAISGNSIGGRVCLRTDRNPKSSDIVGYYRPNWGDSYASSSEGYGPGSPLYTTVSTREDASVREICYISKDAKPSISSKDIRLSVINYTGALNAVYEAFGGGGGVSGDYAGGEVDWSGLGNSNATTIGNYLITHGFTPAQAVGILANIYKESNYNPGAIGDSGTSFGIAQWHNERGTAMKQYVGSNWATNLEKQCEYLVKEVKEKYTTSTYNPIMEIKSNNADSAAKVASIWCLNYEIPANKEAVARERAELAREMYGKIKITSTGTVNLTGSNNEDKIWNFLRSKGYSKAATAAVIGNMYAESNLDPTAHTADDSGYGPGGGLCGWLACYFGEMWKKSLEEQLLFVVNHFVPEQNATYGTMSLSSFTNGTDARYLAGYFDDYIERSSGEMRSWRQNKAAEVLNRH